MLSKTSNKGPIILLKDNQFSCKRNPFSACSLVKAEALLFHVSLLTCVQLYVDTRPIFAHAFLLDDTPCDERSQSRGKPLFCVIRLLWTMYGELAFVQVLKV